MAALITVAELATDFLGNINADDDEPMIQLMLDSVEDALESKTDQKFGTGQTIVDEPHDGSGRDVQRVDRPLKSLDAAVKIGQDPSDFIRTIPTADIELDQARQRLLYRLGRKFPRGKRNVFISYTSNDNLPNVAKLAVGEGTSFFYRRRGKEHITGESLGELGSVTLIAARLARLPAWELAIATLTRTPFA